jgi:uncharacterized protein YyaL (SSP411 family)
MARGSNQLSAATSPYLLQHADNPVHWHQWGTTAFEEAAERDVPILLSIGYASCHWCHVMAHESFEDESTANVMNQLFVNVKVDREERPDIDSIYMDAVQAMTGRGGWPMTVFLTPDRRPFFAGTYFPPQDRPGHPSFVRVLRSVDEAWRTHRSNIERQAGQLTQAIAGSPPTGDSLDDEIVTRAYSQITRFVDPVNGGFGTAPKFPQSPVLEFLLRVAGRSWAPDAAGILRDALTAMARGGIHDVIGGGFSRYTVDDRWLVPHFEKMLYDNAQLARIYAIAAGVTGVEEFATVARTTLDYMARDLGLPDGGFASGEDADSEGVEGRFYVFSWDEIRQVTDSAAIAAILGVTPGGNFEGKNILHRSRTVPEVAAEMDLDPVELDAELARTVDALRTIRSRRVRPSLDDKAVCAWNGLAIRALADTGRVLGHGPYVERASRAARFVLDRMRGPDGRIMRSWRAGQVSGPGFCDDYAALAVGLFALYTATADPFWYSEAAEITRGMIDLFWDADNGGFHSTGSDAEELITRPRSLFDNPTPSDNSLAAEAMQHLAAYTGELELRDMIDRTLRTVGDSIEKYPLGAGHALAVLAVEQNPPIEVALVGNPDARAALAAVLDRKFRPEVFRALGDGIHDGGVPLLANRPTTTGEATAYVCRGFVCDAPITTPAALAEALD